MLRNKISREVEAIVQHKLDAAIELHKLVPGEREDMAKKLRQFYRYNGYVPDVLIRERGDIN